MVKGRLLLSPPEIEKVAVDVSDGKGKTKTLTLRLRVFNNADVLWLQKEAGINWHEEIIEKPALTLEILDRQIENKDELAAALGVEESLERSLPFQKDGLPLLVETLGNLYLTAVGNAEKKKRKTQLRRLRIGLIWLLSNCAATAMALYLWNMLYT